PRRRGGGTNEPAAPPPALPPAVAHHEQARVGPAVVAPQDAKLAGRVVEERVVVGVLPDDGAAERARRSRDGKRRHDAGGGDDGQREEQRAHRRGHGWGGSAPSDSWTCSVPMRMRSPQLGIQVVPTRLLPVGMVSVIRYSRSGGAPDESSSGAWPNPGSITCSLPSAVKTRRGPFEDSVEPVLKKRERVSTHSSSAPVVAMTLSGRTVTREVSGHTSPLRSSWTPPATQVAQPRSIV